MWSTGRASTISTPAEATTATTGCRSTGLRMADQKRFSPPSRRSRWRNGILPFSTLSPSRESSAGSTVSEPSIATATTVIVATPNEVYVRSCANRRPGHRDHHGQAGDEHRPAGRGGGGLERGPRP